MVAHSCGYGSTMILTCSAIIIALAAGLADAVYYGSGTVGASCNFNTDCVTAATMYCNVGACACYSDYTSYLGYCYAKIDPGTSGCAYDFQCSAVWPGAFCEGSTGGAVTDGTCRCSSPEYVEKQTRDGTVCVKIFDAYGGYISAACPLPENGGQYALLNNHPDLATGAVIPFAQCNPAATAADTTDPTAGLCQYTNSDSTFVDVSDRYDCITPEVDSGLNGICCPNRAFTCIQSRRTTSTAITAETRYWYNSVTGGCEPFLWDPFDITGINVSPNNFRTLEHCQTYCGGTCDRGSPAYETPTTTTLVEEQTPDQCTYTTDCADSTNYACELVDSDSYCCPTVASNCGPYGGLADTTQALPNLGLTTINYESQTRYYYNEDTLTCTSFTYQGSGGNYNNFLSEASCLQYCQASVCTQGNPLKDAVGATLTCGSSTSCPSTHTCYNSRCCPKPRFVCQQEKRPGDGASSTNIRYWWNQYTRQCEELLYTGQNGNDNNFLTLTACQSYCSNIRIAPQCQQGEALVDTGVDQYTQCGTTSTTSCGTNYECTFDGYVYGCCPTKAYVCGISSSTGIVCNGPASTRYYYNTLTQTCTSFSFNGCDGNPNNFRDLNTCNTFCGAGGCPYGGTPYQATSSSSFQTCATTADCVGNYECTTVTAGLTNNNYCCPSRSFVCQQSIYSGANCGTVSVTRWVYRYTTGVCEQFTFTGCAGTSNSFATQQQCLTFCGSSACLPGEVARADAFGSPLSCSSDASCGTGYKCRFDTLTSRSFCCGSDAAGVCNVDQRAYLDPSTGAASQCTPSLGSTACYTGFNCQLNTVLGKYYCCTSLNGTVCPVNRAPYQLNNVAQSCSLSVSGVCPTGYSCQTPLGAGYTSYTGFCCTSNDVCPTGGDYFRETTGTFIGSARACTIGGVACPTGFYCAPLNGGTSGYCCSGGVGTPVNGGCPPGQYIQILTTSPTTYAYCNPFNGQLNGGCASTYPTCQWSIEMQNYVCCGLTATVQPGGNNGGCPGNQIALYSGTSVVTCSSNAQCSGQAGYFCQYSTVNSRLQCCAVKGTCTGTAVAFVDTNGNTVSCSADSQCAGYGPYVCLAGNCCTGGTGSTNCGTNQILFNGQCVATGLFIGQSCVTSAQCTGSSGSQCIGSVCTCPTGTTTSGNQCVASAQIGQACTAATQCQGGSVCTGGICSCPSGQTNQGGVCRVASNVAPTCKTVGSTALMTSGVAFNCLRSTCSSGYACEWNSVYNGGQYICCTTATTTTANRCPTGQTELASRQTCLTSNCPSTHTCTYYSTGNTYVCCQSSTAANNPTSRCGSAKIEQSGQPNCLYSYCAFGYNCEYLSSYRSYACCASSAATGSAANPSSSVEYCSGSYLKYYNTNIGVECGTHNDCAGTQYPKCLMESSMGKKFCCASGVSQSYGK